MCYLATTSVAKMGGKSMFEKGQCQTDIFSVTAPGNNAPPVICGTNSGEHSKNYIIFCKWLRYDSSLLSIVYVDSSEMCNELAFQIGSGTSTVTRSWSIKV